MTDNTPRHVRLRDIYGPGFTQEQYLRALAAGYETGWWDEHGRPAPWPEELHQWPAAHPDLNINREDDDNTNPKTDTIEPTF